MSIFISVIPGARIAEGEDRDRLWSRQKELYPGFADYEAKTARGNPGDRPRTHAVTTPPVDAPTIEAIRANRARLGDLVVTTPVRLLVDDALAAAVGASTQVWLKEELFQRTGSFKPRGALSVMLDLDAAALARMLGTTATVVMPKTANPFRVQVCREFGATVVLVENVHEAFDRVKHIEAEEGRTFVHPYEGPKTALGTASVGMELVAGAYQGRHVALPRGHR